MTGHVQVDIVAAMPAAGAEQQGIELTSDAILRRHGRSFFWARFLFGRRIAAQATRLYAFCRIVDDLADGDLPVESSGASLRQVREALHRGHADAPWVQDFLDLAAESGMDRRAALCLVVQLEADRGAVCIDDPASLLRYCHGVAGTVGLLMSPVLGCRGEAGHYHAVDLGIAMQLTNICRDVQEDALRGRRYLPAELVGNLSPAQVLEARGACALRIRAGVQQLLQQAEAYYDSGLAGLRWLPWHSRFGVATAALLYREIGRVLKQRQYDVWQGRCRVGTLRKLALTLQAVLCVLGLAVPRRHSALPPVHRAALHDGLQGLVGTNPAVPDTPRADS